jgi:hypothetical protein
MWLHAERNLFKDAGQQDASSRHILISFTPTLGVRDLVLVHYILVLPTVRQRRLFHVMQHA